MKIARKISPIIRIGVNKNPGIQGKPHGNPHGNPQGKPHGNPVIAVKPEKNIAQMNTAKSMPNIEDPSSKGLRRWSHLQSSLERRAEPQPLQ
jgi:hypothetical protein